MTSKSQGHPNILQRTQRRSTLLRGLFLAISQILILTRLVQAEPSGMTNPVDMSLRGDYLRNFLEPDDEQYRNTAYLSPMSWHVKETLQVLKMWNLPGEEHIIVTDDGYIMSLFRITPKTDNATPVLFLHGFQGSPETWVLRGGEDLAYMLVEAGYDVWLASYRGGYYGRKHVNMTTGDIKFWDFSFHEHAYYDVPKMIDHILEQTKAHRVSLIGHSMGNAIFSSMLSMRPNYNDKINVFVGMAPYVVVRVYVGIPRKLVLPSFMTIAKLNDNTMVTDFMRRMKINPHVFMCRTFPWSCSAFLATEWGSHYEESTARMKLLPVMLAYVPSGSSHKTAEHLIQLEKGQFRQFDYGLFENMRRYKQPAPLEYKLSNVRVPVSLYYGETDKVVPPASMKVFARYLPNVVKTTIVPGYNHVDFLLASNTREALYEPIMADLRRYSHSM